MARRLAVLLGSAALLLPLAEPLGQRSGAVARTLLAMAATATATPAQAQAQETEIWSATLTVGQHATFENLKGFFGGGTIGDLSDIVFDLDGTSVTVKIVQVNNDDGNLRFGLTTNFPDNSRSKLILQVGDDRFPFPVGSSDDLDLTDWSNSGLTWTTGDTIAIKLIQSEVTDPPTVTSITRQTPAASSTNADSLTWRVVFSQSVTNVDSADFVVDGTTATLSVAEVTGQTGAWDVTASGGDLAGLNGTVTLSFAPDQNIVGSLFALSNTTPAGSSENSYELDNTAPTVSYTPPGSMTVGTAITASPRTTATDIAIYSATGLPSGLTINPTTGVISGTVATARSTITNVTVTVTDRVGNSADVMLEFPSVQEEDTLSPRVTSITRLVPTTSPTNADSLTWRVVFSEAVTNVDSADFVVDGTTATLSVAPVTDQTGGWDVTASGGNLAGLDGTVTLSLASGQDIEDMATPNPNSLSNTTPTTGTNEDYELDNTAPTVDYTVPASLTVGRAISSTPDTTDTDIAQYSATNLPDGLTIDPITGEISGSLETVSASTSIAVVTVTDTTGNTVDVTVTFPVVEATNIAPTVTRAVLEITPGTPGTTPTQAEIDAYKNDPDNAVILAAIPDDDEDEYVTGILSNPATSDRVRKIDLYLSESITSTASGFPFISSGNLVDAFTITVNDVESTSSIYIVYNEDDLKITITPSGGTIGVDGKVEIDYSRATAGTEALQGATGNRVDDFTRVLRDDPAATPTATTVDYYTLPASLEVGSPIRLVPTTTGSHNIGRFTLPNSNGQTPSWMTINEDNGVISGTPDTAISAFTVEVRVFDQAASPIDVNGDASGNDLRLRFPEVNVREIPSLENRPPTVESAELRSEDSQILVIFSDSPPPTVTTRTGSLSVSDLKDAFTVTADGEEQPIRFLSHLDSEDRLTIVLSSAIPTDATNVILIYDPSALGNDSNGDPQGLEDTDGNLVEAFRQTLRGVDDSTAPTVSYTALPDPLVVGTAITPIEPTTQDTDIASYTATGLPPGLMIAEDTGIISGTPSQVRPFPSIVTVTVTDTAGNSANVRLDLPVIENRPGVSVTPITILNLVEGSTASYAVTLRTEPTTPVTITAVSGNSGAVSVSPASLTFSTTDWNTAQTVSVTGVQDADTTDETVTISHSVSGYGTVTTAPAVTVSVTDDEGPRVSVDPTDLGTIMESGTTAYTLVLEIPPSVTVTITPTSDDSGAVSVSPASLTFTTTDWNMAQTVSVTAVEDPDTTDERVTISHSVSGDGDLTSVAAVTVSVEDNDEDPGVRVAPSTHLSTLEGKTTDYTLVLTTEPTGAVTITPASHVTGAVSLSPASLTFTTINWDTAQTVSVTGEQDTDMNNETVTISHSVSGYGAVTAAAAVTVRVTDDEQTLIEVCDRTPAVQDAILQRIDGVTGCDEVSAADLNGMTGRLSVNSLSTLEVGDFADLSSLQQLDLNGNLSSLPTGIFSDLTALKQLYLNNNNLNSLDANIFAGLSALEDLYLNNNSLSSLPSGIFSDLTALYEIWLHENSLTSLPDDIFNGLSNLERLLLNNNSLSSLPASIFAGLTSLDTLHSSLDTLRLNDNSLSSLPDGIFDGLSNLANLRLVNNGLECLPGTDHTALWQSVASDALTLDLPDCFGVSLSVTPTEVEEGNGGDIITVTATLSSGVARPSSRPTEVAISVANGTATGGMDFTAVNDFTITIPSGSVSQTGDFTLAAAADAEVEPAGETVLVNGTATDLSYSAEVAGATVTIQDAPGVIVEPVSMSGAEVVDADEGGTGAYTVKLNTMPAGAVTITATSDDSGAVSVSPASLTFTTTDWNTAQTVSVTGVEDPDTDDETVTISHSVSGYGSVTAAAAVTVTVTDDEEAPGVSVQATSPIPVAEGGTATYTLKLDTQPAGAVTITPTSGDSGAVSVSPASLTFTTSNWNTDQTVSVTGVEDANDIHETVTISHSVSGYGSVTTARAVTVTVTDDEEAPGVSVQATSPIPVAEGGTATYTLKLDTQPAGAVTITPTSGDSGAVSVSPASLTFTRSNWNTDQTVSVTGVEDANDIHEIVTISHSVSGYGSVTADAVTVSVTDDEGPRVSVQPTSPIPVAEGGTATYTLELGSQPAGPVTITPTSGDSGAVSVSPASLTFTTADWNTAQTVSVTGVEDPDTDDETVTISHSVSGYGSVTTAPDVTVSVADEDMDDDAADPNEQTGNGTTPGPLPDPSEPMVPDDRDATTTTPTVTLSRSSQAVNEEGGGLTFTLTLDEAAASDLTVGVTISETGDMVAATDEGLRTVMVAQGRTRATFTVATEDDHVDEADSTVSVRLLADTAAPATYQVGSAAAATVTVTDNDTAGVSVSTATLTVDEGSSGGYTLVLDSQPGGNVTITAVSGDSGAVSLSPASLTFTAANWDTPRTVSVTGVEDPDTTAETVTISHGISGYGTVTVADAVTVSVTDTTQDDTTKARQEAKAVLDEVVVPEVLQQVTAQTTEVITSRLNSIASGSPGAPPALSLEEVVADTVAFFHGEREQLKNGSLEWQQAVAGRSFALPLSSLNLAQGEEGVMSEEDPFSTLAVWGSGDYASYGNTIEGTQVDGDGFSGAIGIDLQPMPRLVTGLALTTSRWGLDYTTNTDGNREAGTYAIGVTTVNPYLNWLATDQLSLWAAVGYGRGEVEQDPEGRDATSRSDDLTSWAGGLRFEAIPAVDSLTGEGSPFALALKVDGATSSFLDTDVQLARLAAEVSRSFPVETGLLSAALELGWSIRSVSDQDDPDDPEQRIGDKNNGGGAELAGRLHWRSTDGSVSAAVDTRVLLGGDDRSEWGIGGQLRITPSKRDGEGLSLSLQPAFGVTGTRLDELWSLSGDGDLAINNDRPGGRLDAELAYGFPLGDALLSPYTEVVWEEAASTYGAGLRYGLNASLELDLKGAHRSGANGNDENRLLLEVRSRP